ILTSRMHMAWLGYIGGRLKSDFRYSIGIVYNSFPWPVVSLPKRVGLAALAQGVLDARMTHPRSTLADLYDSVAMPPDLRKAHSAIDRAVDALYRDTPFDSDRSRVEHLFGLYESMTQGLFAKNPSKRGRRTKS
ncbi:MAG TPA: type IIL restriction-modification enzyme MmeI, partial [Gemmatimonadaceae bacterium]